MTKLCRHIVCILFFVFLMSSCGTRRMNYSYSIDEEWVRKIEAILEKQQEIISTWVDRSELFENVEIIEREFDIYAGPDSLGGYPVKKETVTKKESSKKNNIESKVEDNIKIDSSYADEVKDDLHNDSDIKEEKKESSFSFYITCVIVFLVILAVTFLLDRLGILKILKV